MNNIKQSILLASAALLALASCSTDDANMQGGEPRQGTPILLGSVVSAPLTRASSGIQSTQLADNEQVNVYISEVGGSEYSPKVYTVNDGGNLSPLDNIYPYFPAGDKQLKIYALYPTTLTKDARRFTVRDDQDRQAQYKASDFMYGQLEDASGNVRSVAKTTDRQTLVFHHMLSKITVTLKSGEGSPNVAGAAVQLCGVFREIGFIVNSETLAGHLSAGSQDEENRGYVTVTSATTANSAGVASSVSAVIPPQTIRDGHYFLKIRLKGSGDSSVGDVVYYTPGQPFDLESGKEYKFNVTINQNGLKVDYTVAPWLSTQDDGGNDNNIYTGRASF